MNLETGDHVRAVGALVSHHGIVDMRSGEPRVIHSSARLGGVVETSLEEFAGRRRVELVQRPAAGQGAVVADRARARLGEPWHPTRANCEHLAFGSCGEPTSPQVEESWLPGWAAGVAGVLLLVGGVVAASVVVRVPRLRPVRMECASDGGLVALARRLSASVVALRVQGRRGRALGSGVVVGDGLVVTNEHVIRDALEVVGCLAGEEPVRAEVLATEPRMDLALVRVQGVSAALPLAASVTVGERVFALGAPHGLELSVTTGIVAGVHRGNLDHAPDIDFIQADVAIAPGSSGGGLFNLCGELVGITTAASSSGFAFCVPARQVREFLARHALSPATQWLRNSTRVRIYLRDTPPGQRSPACVYCGRAVRVGQLPSDSEAGLAAAVVDHVFPDGPNDHRNLVTCCWACNAEKGNRTPDEWEDYRESLGLPRLPRWRSRRPEPPGPLIERVAAAVRRPLCDDSDPECAARLEDLERRRVANAEAGRWRR